MTELTISERMRMHAAFGDVRIRQADAQHFAEVYDTAIESLELSDQVIQERDAWAKEARYWRLIAIVSIVSGYAALALLVLK